MANIVIVPPSLSFHTSQPKQTVALCNLEIVPVKFSVKCTAPEKYLISTTEGTIEAQHKVSIQITHSDICVMNENIRDTVRIIFSVRKQNKFVPVGHKDVPVVLSLDPSSWRGDSTAKGSPSHSPSQAAGPTSKEAKQQPGSQNGAIGLYLVAVVLGLVGLWLPTQGTVEGVPWYLELSVNTKIAIAFMLGVLSTLLFQQIQKRESQR